LYNITSNNTGKAIVGIGIAMADQWWRGRVPDIALQDLVEELIDFAFEGIGIPNRPEPGR
ncbi:MAG TPA: hypothetical protein PK313_15845, partial [Myxococcota bacterium]|nr:hypothetical protein [Myxococcota bacterium]